MKSMVFNTLRCFTPFFGFAELAVLWFYSSVMRLISVHPSYSPIVTIGSCLCPINHGFMTLSRRKVHDCMKKLRYCPSRSIDSAPWGQLAVGFKAGADCIITEVDGGWYAKSERGTNTYPIHHEAQIESEFQPVLSCWRGSRKGCVDCSRACPEIDPAVKARREALMSPAVVASQRARKRIERFLVTNEVGVAMSGRCTSEKVSSLMKILGAKGGRSRSEKKRLAAKRNILKRWATKRSE